MGNTNKGRPCLPDYETIQQFIEASGQGSSGFPLVDKMYTFLKSKELSEALNRYSWIYCPEGINQDIIERILYYRGDACIFYLRSTGKFYCLPYAPVGQPDIYGRYLKVTPLPFYGSSEVRRDANDNPIQFIPGFELEVVYDPILPEEWTPEVLDTKCVLIHDRNLSVNQKTISRESLNDIVIKMMAECPAMGRTNLMANSGITAWRVGNEEMAEDVESASDSVEAAAMTGRPFIATVGAVDMQGLTSNGRADIEQYYQAMQSLDNLRLMGFGLKSNGLFDKDNAYINNQQIGNQQQNIGLVYQDGLEARQYAAMLCTTAFGTVMDAIASESVTNTDNDMDGVVGNDKHPLEGNVAEELDDDV